VGLIYLRWVRAVQKYAGTRHFYTLFPQCIGMPSSRKADIYLTGLMIKGLSVFFFLEVCPPWAARLVW
jgi:hypothetical protein